jgi:hypothetical protein
MQMSNPTPAHPHAEQWATLLAEHRLLQDELSLSTLSNKPPSRLQVAQLAASAARLQKLSLKLRDLVEDWSANARAGASQTAQ